MMGVLEGVVMELTDCALPLLYEIVPTADPGVAFKDVDAAFLVGAMPRKEGMERKDLLSANVKIFKIQVFLRKLSTFYVPIVVLLLLYGPDPFKSPTGGARVALCMRTPRPSCE